MILLIKNITSGNKEVILIYLCISADYELFFYKNHLNSKKILVEPTDKLLEICNKYSAPVTLFVDTLAIFRHLDFGLHDFVNMLEGQIKNAMRTGHDIQLHIHPHWINSIYASGKWEFDYKYYRIHDFESGSYAKDSVYTDLIKSSKLYLENLLKEESDSYKCIAYRAGGYCIQPEKLIFEKLIENGVKIDSSIFKNGYSSKRSAHYYDFRNTPSKANWYIDPEKGLQFESKRSDKSIFEVPIGSYLSVFENIRYFSKVILKKIFNRENKSRGEGMPNKNSNIIDKLKRVIKTPMFLSFDYCDASLTYRVLKSIEKENRGKDIYISLICHPKSLTSKHLEEVELFFNKIKKNKLGIKFVKFQDIYEKIYN